MELWLWVLSTPLFMPTTITAEIRMIQGNFGKCMEGQIRLVTFTPTYAYIPVPLLGWMLCCSSPKSFAFQLSKSDVRVFPTLELHVRKATCFKDGPFSQMEELVRPVSFFVTSHFVSFGFSHCPGGPAICREDKPGHVHRGHSCCLAKGALQSLPPSLWQHCLSPASHRTHFRFCFSSS